MDDVRGRDSRFRVAWRWTDSGLTGASAWVQDAWIVEGWLVGLSGRHADRMQHWIETDVAEGPDRRLHPSHTA